MGSRRLHGVRSIVAALSSVALLTLILAPAAALAQEPVRVVPSSDIVIDGSASDWDREADFLAVMYEAGKPDHPIRSTAYAQYDCGTGTMYVFVETIPEFVIVPSNPDNYVKLGNTDKLVDGNSGDDGTPPDFRYIGTRGWEASFQIDEGTWGLNVHAEVVPRNLLGTSAFAGRLLDVIIDCAAQPTPTPVTTPSPTPPPTPTPAPTPTPTPTPAPTATGTAGPTPTGTAGPTPTATTPPPTPTATNPPPTPTATTPPPTPTATTPPATPTATAAPTATDEPTGSVAPTEDPSADPVLIVAKISDAGTGGDVADDSLLPGATFALYLDDGDGVFEPDGDDAPRIDEIDSSSGFHVFTPPGPGRYWVVEVSSPPGYDTSEPMLVDFLLARASQNCVVTDDREFCVADDDPDGGYVMAVVSDSPLAGVDAVTPPPTDSQVLPSVPPLSGPAAAVALLVAISGVSILVATTRRRRVGD